MIAWVLSGIAFLALIVLTIFLLKNALTLSYILRNFKSCNCIVFGKKGSGKDLVFQWVINKRKKPYLSNLTYGGKFSPIKVNDLSVAPNTYKEFIADKITIVPKKLPEKVDVYLSDVGNYLPSQYDSMLDKVYPSFPIYYSLSRHLSNSNVHANTQALSRPWKKLREQADFYVWVRRTYKLPFLLITRVYTYEKYESAEQRLLPMKTSLFNGFTRAEKAQFDATNGEIKSAFIFQWKRSIRYDSRAFHKIIYGIPAPKK